MSVEGVVTLRIRCDHNDEDRGRCSARLHGDELLTEDDVRVLARERGWTTDGRDLCPSHGGVRA